MIYFDYRDPILGKLPITVTVMKSVDQFGNFRNSDLCGGEGEGECQGGGWGAAKVQISSPVILRDSLGGQSPPVTSLSADTDLPSHLMLSSVFSIVVGFTNIITKFLTTQPRL